MSHYLVLAIIWGVLGVFFFFFYLDVYLGEVSRSAQLGPFNHSEPVVPFVLILLSVSSVVSSFWLWRGIIWARIVIGSIAVVFAVVCGLTIWVRVWWGSSFGILDALFVVVMCLSAYTLYIFLTKRPS